LPDQQVEQAAHGRVVVQPARDRLVQQRLAPLHTVDHLTDQPDVVLGQRHGDIHGSLSTRVILQVNHLPPFTPLSCSRQRESVRELGDLLES
jgi:hypothetical protein